MCLQLETNRGYKPADASFVSLRIGIARSVASADSTYVPTYFVPSSRDIVIKVSGPFWNVRELEVAVCSLAQAPRGSGYRAVKYEGT